MVVKASGDGRSSLALGATGARTGFLARGLAATIAEMLPSSAPAPARGSGASPLPAMVPMVHYACVVAQRRGIGKPEFHQKWLLPIEATVSHCRVDLSML